jgi:hypothetical protein
MLSVTLLVVLAAFVCAIGSAMGKVPLWVAVVLLCIAQLLGILPR